MSISIDTSGFFSILNLVPLLFYFVGGLIALVIGLLFLLTTIFPTFKLKIGDKEHIAIDKPRTFFASLILIGLSISSVSFAFGTVGGQIQYFFVGGGGNTHPCSDLPNLACFGINSNSGAVSATNSTLCTSGNTQCDNHSEQINIQSGTANCTISAGSSTCITSQIPLSPAIARPLLVEVGTTSIAGSSVATYDSFDLTGQNGTGFWDWKIPAAATEWLGVANARTSLSLNGFSFLGLQAWIQTTGAGPAFNVYLTLQYSVNAGSTWTDMFPANGALNVGSFDVNSCTEPGATAVPCMAQITVTIPAGAQPTGCTGTAIASCPLLRLVGYGGDGATEVSLGPVSVVLIGPNTTILCAGTVTSETGTPVTSFQITITCAAQLTSSNSLSVAWIASVIRSTG